MSEDNEPFMSPFQYGKKRPKLRDSRYVWNWKPARNSTPETRAWAFRHPISLWLLMQPERETYSLKNPPEWTPMDMAYRLVLTPLRMGSAGHMEVGRLYPKLMVIVCQRLLDDGFLCGRNLQDGRRITSGAGILSFHEDWLVLRKRRKKDTTSQNDNDNTQDTKDNGNTTDS